MVKELQDIIFNIFLFTSQRQIQFTRLPRDQNSQADFLSKIVVVDSDYSLHDEGFFHLANPWGPHSVADLLAVMMRNCLSLIPDPSNPVLKLLTPSHRTGQLRITGWCHQYLSSIVRLWEL